MWNFSGIKVLEYKTLRIAKVSYSNPCVNNEGIKLVETNIFFKKSHDFKWH